MRVLVTTLALTLALAAPALATGQTRKTAKARKAGDKKRGPKFPAVALYHVNHHENMTYRPYDAQGRFRKAELQRFNRFMRDGSGKGGRVGRMHPRLATLFYRVARYYVSQGKRIEVISGYRPAARNSRSPHKKGLAVDFRVKGVSNAALRDYLRKSYDKVGVGYYPNSVFVHFDVRQRSAFWIDYSGPGEEAEYSSDPVGDLKTGRADKYKPAKAGSAADDADEKAGTGEDGPPPGEDSAEPPRKAEPAPRDENGAAEEKPAAEPRIADHKDRKHEETRATVKGQPVPKDKPAADKPAKAEPKPAVPDKKDSDKKPAPEKKPDPEKGAKGE